MVNMCFKKCVANYREPDLHVGELACTDRCVGKYMAAQEKVTERMQELQQKAQEAQLQHQQQLMAMQAEQRAFAGAS